MKISRRISEQEHSSRSGLLEQFQASPIPDTEVLANLPLYLNRQTLSRLLWVHELYQRIIPVHGVVMEFGVRWGRDLALFTAMRGIYEPYNYSRKIVGFDTFQGFPAVSERDSASMSKGDYGVTENYRAHLEAVVRYHELESPMAHIEKTEIVAGDVRETAAAYLEAHPETIVALAYFDLDLYEPTAAALRAIQPYLTRGSVLAFDELGSSEFPGETVALREVLGLTNVKIERMPLHSFTSFLVVD